ncbi:unnamed protein product [Staurois parvus]|uniref:Uncharacterized protein n=1 Tax=Staurois parvus TaxID=386267 RepID=A0ABN9CTI6_9NEOB|nr:unnamed protein product [Staurois parvus]
MSLLTFLNFSLVLSPVHPVCPDACREWKTDACIGRRRWPGTLQGGHRRSAGQGKCWRDP